MYIKEQIKNEMHKEMFNVSEFDKKMFELRIQLTEMPKEEVWKYVIKLIHTFNTSPHKYQLSYSQFNVAYEVFCSKYQGEIKESMYDALNPEAQKMKEDLEFILRELDLEILNQQRKQSWRRNC